MTLVRFIARVLCAALLGVVVGAVLTPSPVRACSCDSSQTPIRDQIGEAEIAFVGRLTESTVLDPAQTLGYDTFDRRYEFVVQEAVKGVEAGDQVVMFGSTIETSCGSTLLDETRDRHAIISRAYGGPFVADSSPACGRAPGITELLDADLALPPTLDGQLSLLAVGRLSEAELIGFDASGHPLNYGDVEGTAGTLAICPASTTAVILEQPRGADRADLVIRDVATLQVRRRIQLELPAGFQQSSRGMFTAGAQLNCLDSTATEVVAVLSWENSAEEQTIVIHVRPDLAGGVVVHAHGMADRARFDPRLGDVVAVVGGSLLRIDLSGAEHVVAQLTDAATTGYGTLFIKPDESDGWWVGLGDGDYTLATRLKLLAHVGHDGVVERWPVQPAEWLDDVYWDPVVAVEGALLAANARIPLPALGSSASGVSVVSEQAWLPLGKQLGDGRSIAQLDNEAGRSFHVVAVDASLATLQHVAELRSAVAVLDGPLVVAPVIDSVTPPDQLVDSPWITRSADAGLSAPVSTPSSPVAEDADESLANSEYMDDAGLAPVVVVVAVLAVAAAATVTVMWARRRRRPG